MNDAHLHLVVNHFPIIGTIFGLGILIIGMVLKNKTAINIAYILFVISAIFGFASMFTGEGAEEMVEDLPSIGDRIIHEHEEMAEKLAIILYALGAISLVGLYLNYKQHSKANLITYLAMVVAVVGALIGKEAGTTGGEVRHTEIRTDSAVKSVTADQEEADED
jgi:uncharacterized membrane protein